LGAIGAKPGRGASTISRELNRNRVVGSYSPQVAAALIVKKLRPFARLAHTLTTDKGKELAPRERITADSKT
jgi:IS30 family transposase